MTIRTRQELENIALNILKRHWEYPIIVEGLKRCSNDVDATIRLVYKENSGFNIFSGACGRGDFDHEMSLLKSGYFKLWEPENENIMTRKVDLTLNIKEIFMLIRNGENKQLNLF